MKISISVLITTLLCVTCQSQAFAASSEVTWTNPDKYRDIRSGNETRKHFRERTFKNFEKHFTKLAKRLPEQQKIKIDVTDVDLAGDILAGGIERLRVIKEIYSPRLMFSYQLIDASGNLVKEEKVKLKDMSFMMHSNLKYRNDSLGYEKKMLDDWFFDTFKDNLAAK
ncbi:MAG: DUF3016 domain-containing protein [Litorilituus sp.]|jgi:hypothetical protein|nr:DUF3016 domain-containing protein [Litorilituus sp.]